MKVEGFAIKCNKYKDYNGIVTVLTKDKVISFQAFGAYKPFSKTNLLLTPLNYCEFVFRDSNKNYLSLKEVSPIIDTRGVIGTITLGFTLNALQDIVIHLLQEEDMPKLYPYLVTSIRKMDLLYTYDAYRIFTALIIVFCEAIKISGYGLEVDKCVITNKTTDLVGLSIADGGLVSKEAFDPIKHIKYSEDKIRIIQKSFHSTAQDILDLDINPYLVREIIKDLILYVKDVTNTDLKSVALIDYVTI